MHCVTAIPPAVLLHLDALAIIDLVLLGDVVPSLALLTSQRHLNPLFIPSQWEPFILRAKLFE